MENHGSAAASRRGGSDRELAIGQATRAGWLPGLPDGLEEKHEGEKGHGDKEPRGL